MFRNITTLRVPSLISSAGLRLSLRHSVMPAIGLPLVRQPGVRFKTSWVVAEIKRNANPGMRDIYQSWHILGVEKPHHADLAKLESKNPETLKQVYSVLQEFSGSNREKSLQPATLIKMVEAWDEYKNEMLSQDDTKLKYVIEAIINYGIEQETLRKLTAVLSRISVSEFKNLYCAVCTGENDYYYNLFYFYKSFVGVLYQFLDKIPAQAECRAVFLKSLIKNFKEVTFVSNCYVYSRDHLVCLELLLKNLDNERWLRTAPRFQIRRYDDPRYHNPERVHAYIDPKEIRKLIEQSPPAKREELWRAYVFVCKNSETNVVISVAELINQAAYIDEINKLLKRSKATIWSSVEGYRQGISSELWPLMLENAPYLSYLNCYIEEHDLFKEEHIRVYLRRAKQVSDVMGFIKNYSNISESEQADWLYLLFDLDSTVLEKIKSKIEEGIELGWYVSPSISPLTKNTFSLIIDSSIIKPAKEEQAKPEQQHLKASIAKLPAIIIGAVSMLGFSLFTRQAGQAEAAVETDDFVESHRNSM